MLGSLCGTRAMSNVVLVTTMWDEVNGVVAAQRERELYDTHWRPMLNNGMRTLRFDRSFQCAWGIVDSILGTDPCPVLDVQMELVDLQKPLSETKAGVPLVETPPQLDFISKIRRVFAR
jgi:hypothetical protein